MTTLEKLTSALCLAVGAAAGDAQTPLYSYTVPAGGYAPNGNLTGYTDSVTGTWTMQYDALNRLQNATASAGAYQGINLQWQYDSFGNRLSQTPSGHSNALVPGPWTGSYFPLDPSKPPNNQMISTSAGTPTYDAAGDVTFDGQATHVAYDAENRVCATMNTMLTPGMTQYIYNAEGQRVAKGHPRNPPAGLGCADMNNFVVTATYVLGLSGEQVTEFDASGSWQHTNVFNGGQFLATYDNRGLHFPQTDPLGTVRVQVSGTGAPEESCASLPFGDGLTCTGINDPTEHHFTSKERDSESGLDYMEARYYGSNMGRFMSPDPLGGHLEDPQTLNRYVYARNNPLMFSDPTGLDFYLQCPQATGSCSPQVVGYNKNHDAISRLVQGVTNADGSFTATQIGNDANGGLVDKTTGTGAYTADVSGSGVSFSQDGGKTSIGGVFVNRDANPTSTDTNIQGSGALSGFKFTFTNSKMEANQTAAGFFNTTGTQSQAEAALQRAGFQPRAGTEGGDEFRSRGSFLTGANSGHFIVNPDASVPKMGDMHFGEHNPYTGIGALYHCVSERAGYCQ